MTRNGLALKEIAFAIAAIGVAGAFALPQSMRANDNPAPLDTEEAGPSPISASQFIAGLDGQQTLLEEMGARAAATTLQVPLLPEPAPVAQIPAPVVPLQPVQAPVMPKPAEPVLPAAKALSPQETVDLIGKKLGDGEVVLVGEDHNDVQAREFFLKLVKDMIAQKKEFVLTFEIPPDEQNLIKEWPYVELLQLAAANGIPVKMIDTWDTSGDTTPEGVEQRNKEMAKNIKEIAEKNPGKGILSLVGKAHIGGGGIYANVKTLPDCLKELEITKITSIILNSVAGLDPDNFDYATTIKPGDKGEFDQKKMDAAIGTLTDAANRDGKITQAQIDALVESLRALGSTALTAAQKEQLKAMFAVLREKLSKENYRLLINKLYYFALAEGNLSLNLLLLSERSWIEGE